MRPFIESLLGWLLRRQRTTVLVQNKDDQMEIERLRVPTNRITLIPGSGVDTVSLAAMPEPDGPLAVGFVKRLLDDKGMRPLFEAIATPEAARTNGPALAGRDARSGQSSSVPDEEINCWRTRPELELLGHVSDIRRVWSQSHIAALPSRREGLPKSLLEATACGRPIIATDVPGCREIARQNHNALSVPPDDAVALANAIERLANEPDLRRRFAEAGRALVEREFSDAQIERDILALYERLLASAATAA